MRNEELIPPVNFQGILMESKAVGFEQWDKAYGFGLRVLYLFTVELIPRSSFLIPQC